MKKAILLHIGMHKCGSTYLQRVLLRNQQALADAGISYPHGGQSHPGNAEGVERANAAQLEAMFDGHTKLALSFEDLISLGARAEPFAKAAGDIGAEVQIIAFVRPFNEYIFGDYSQMMKQHHRHYISQRAAYNGKSFEQFVVARSRQMSPRNWMRAWTDVLPGSSFTLASHRAIRETVSPFLSPAEIDWEVPRHLTNPSLRTEDCDRIAAMIRSAMPAAEIVQAVRDALHLSGEPDTGRTAERIAWIEAVFERQNEALEEDFGYDNRATLPA